MESDERACGRICRRTFLADTGMGFTGLALGAMLSRDASGSDEEAARWRSPDGRPHFQPRAKSVIWIFMVGGVSHLEGFDPKPALNAYAGKTIAQTPYRDALTSPRIQDTRATFGAPIKITSPLFSLQTGYKKYGQSGLEVSDWWPHVGSCADDLAVVRSLYTTDNEHGAQLQFHTGRHFFDGPLPTMGSWIHYGLGTLNQNLPQFVVMGDPPTDKHGGVNLHGASYLGPEHAGVRLKADPQNPLAFSSPGPDRFLEEQKGQFRLLDRLNRLTAIEYPSDPALRARIKSYEIAFRMQTSVPELFKLEHETAEIQTLYGLDHNVTRAFGLQCLGARKLVERGVRFVQIYHGSNGMNGAWDSHSELKKQHQALCPQVDQPIAGLLKDLKQRGLLDETIVVWASEFGRSPCTEQSDGRDHHPFGFSAWLAGGGIKGGVVHGATDEIGFHAVEDSHYITDIHATILHQLGLDPRKLEVPGRKRLEIDFGEPIKEIIA